jgi:hypothetical protein
VTGASVSFFYYSGQIFCRGQRRRQNPGYAAETFPQHFTTVHRDSFLFDTIGSVAFGLEQSSCQGFFRRGMRSGRIVWQNARWLVECGSHGFFVPGL